MLRLRFPRTFELIDQIDDRSDSRSYFREFESRITDPDRERVWTAREREFQKLDRDAWNFLKVEAQPYLKTKNQDGRAWSQLISALNESRGYIYIKGLGCSDVHFIPKVNRNGVESPDVRGVLRSRSELCEVKTIHISDDAVRARQNGDSTSTENNLSPEFLKKLDRTIEKAKDQLLAYPVEGDVGRSILTIINFDDYLGEYKVEYYEQIDNHIGIQPEDGTVLVFFNSCTAFHKTVKMKNAVVINE
ncbi:MAG: hypothetical protein IT495_03925 [Gammaproteobacteria bacterium]|nr:hypothetical protein [Gammaproteobacteria bacterium]